MQQKERIPETKIYKDGGTSQKREYHGPVGTRSNRPLSGKRWNVPSISRSRKRK